MTVQVYQVTHDLFTVFRVLIFCEQHPSIAAI